MDNNEKAKDVRGPRNVLDKAWDDLLHIDMLQLSRTAGADKVDEGSCSIRFFATPYQVDRAKRVVSRIDGERPVHRFIAALILHYLIGAKDTEPTGKMLTFRELPGGEVYYDAFYRRAIQPLAADIGPRPQLLLERAKRVGGERMDFGDASVRIAVFPRIPVVVVAWMGDEEVPSSANMLFDSTASAHLHTEDLAAIGDLVADSLVLSDEEWRGW